MNIKNLLSVTISNVPTFVLAQASYMHEAQEDSGNPITGLLGLLILGSIVYVISNFKNFFSKSSTPIKNNDVIVQPTKEISVENICSDNVKVKANNPNHEFNNLCIDIYGKFAEIVGDYIIIKEDGNYCVINNKDKRYNPIYSYIKKSFLKRTYLSYETINIELLNIYIDSCLKEGKLSYAKPMKERGHIEEDFYGGRIIALRMYYDEDFKWFRGHYISSCHSPIESLFDYINAIGFDLAIYLHKKIITPMDLMVYKEIKDMQSLGMTVYDYKNYCNLYKGKIVQKGNKYYDAQGNFIGNSFSEASNYWNIKFMSFEKAKKEIDNISWHL